MKKGQVTIFIIIALIIVLGIILVTYYSKENNVGISECVVDEDCVKSACCHASSCVSSENAPECSGIYCTQACEPGTLDCEQGSCECVNKKCEAVFG